MNFESIYEDPVKSDIAYPTIIDGFTFISNNCKLSGTMHVAQGRGPHPTIILLHGIPGYEQNFDIAHILLRNGFNVMIFHYRGNWGSEGSYSIKHVLEDTENAIQFLKSKENIEAYRIDINNLILIGHSLGGFAALMTVANHPEIRLTVSIAGFNFGLFGEMISNNADLMKTAVQKFDFVKRPVIQGITPAELLQEIVKNNIQWNLLNIAEKLRGHSILMIGAIRDTDSQIDQNFKPLVESFKKERVDFKDVLIDADHCFCDKKITLAKEILKWLHDEKACLFN